jgi:hypothetical protein
MQPTPGAYPATLTYNAPDRIANWRPIVQWLLAIPHLIVLYVLNFICQIIAIISWFVILITGRLPDGIANFQAMYLRYTYRTYSYAGFLREPYPPFGFTTSSPDPGDDPPIRVDITPDLENRNRLTVAFRIILAIPHLIVLTLLTIAAVVAWIIAFFAVLFTGRWPEGLRTFIVNFMRYGLRVNAYLFLLVDEYPPFALS